MLVSKTLRLPPFICAKVSKNEADPEARGPDESVVEKQAAAIHCLPPLSPYPKIRGLGSLKEVIQPQVPLRLPCYDFTPIIGQTVGASFPKVRLTILGPTNFRGVTGGVYKARERIHRGMLIRDY